MLSQVLSTFLTLVLEHPLPILWILRFFYQRSRSGPSILQALPLFLALWTHRVPGNPSEAQEAQLVRSYAHSAPPSPGGSAHPRCGSPTPPPSEDAPAPYSLRTAWLSQGLFPRAPLILCTHCLAGVSSWYQLRCDWQAASQVIRGQVFSRGFWYTMKNNWELLKDRVIGVFTSLPMPVHYFTELE